MNTFTIHLSEDDSSLFVVSRIGENDLPRVLLVCPEHWDGYKKLDLVLFQRKARKMDKQLALVSKKKDIIALAKGLNIPVFPSVEDGQKMSWRRWYSRRYNKLLIDQIPYIRKNVLSKPKRYFNNNAGALHVSWWKRVPFMLLGILSVSAVVFIFVPKAEIHLDPEKDLQTITLNVWANPTIPEPNLSGGLPARLDIVEISGYSTGISSGYVSVPDQYSSGKVELINLTSGVVSVPYGTVVQTTGSPPVRFRIMQTVNVPPGDANAIEVEIQAIMPGSSGNIDEGEISAFSGTLGLYLKISNLEATSGGSDRQSTSPSENDYHIIRQKLIDELKEKVLEQIDISGQTMERMIIPNTIKLEEVVEELPKPGIPADNLSLSIKVKYSVWYIDKKDINALALSVLDASLPEGSVPINESFETEIINTPEYDGEFVHWQISARRNIQQEIPADLTQHLVGLDRSQAARILMQKLKLVSRSKINITPSWLPTLPLLPFRIELSIQ